MAFENIDWKVVSPFAVGMVGSVVGLKWAPGANWGERAFNVCAGAACAGFFGPALADWWHINMDSVRYALAFGVGTFGLSLAAAVVEGIRAVKLGEIITGWLSRR